MASKADIEAYYDTFGVLHRLRMEHVQGPYPDFTCAYYNGDFSLPYAEAQSNKYRWIFDRLGFGQKLERTRILDIGCGWGPILNAVRERGGTAVGLTLSKDQVRHCQAHGLNAMCLDYKDLGYERETKFDGVVSIGAFEHFCSISEMQHGRQERIYKDFFARCAARLPRGGRLFLQTMLWGERVPDYHRLTLDAPANSPEAILARMQYMYPGSWLPNSLEQIVRCAGSLFVLEEHSNGRLDYLETLRQWGLATPRLWSRKMLHRTAPRFLSIGARLALSRQARLCLSSILHNDQEECFRQGIMTHERIFFRKR